MIGHLCNVLFVPQIFTLLQNHPRYDFVEEGVAGDERQVLCLFKDEKMHLVKKNNG